VPRLQIKQLDKRFGQHYALKQCSLSVDQGEVHALVGENGAGKSTLIKIVTGVYGFDGGQIIWNGEPVTISNPNDARKLGINVVHQDRHLIDSFTGYENLFLGLEYPTKAKGLKVNWKEMRQRAKQLQNTWGISLDLDQLVQNMRPPEKTMLEILRAVMLECQLLILDEPTASLTDQETERLFALIDSLKQKGTSILYVSHRMDEIFQISDRITVLRNGQVVGTKRTADVSKDQIIAMMTEEETTNLQLQREASENDGQLVLEVKNVATQDGKVRKADLEVRAGEIVGLFGLTGSGRTELLEAIYGLRPIQHGEVKVAEKSVRHFTPKASLQRGVVLIPEDRLGRALITSMSIRENITLPVLQRFSQRWKMAAGKERNVVVEWVKSLKIKATDVEQAVDELSGGNQQKVVFAKALIANPILFLCDEPTQAVDVMTRAEIHRLLQQQAKEQRGVLYVSSDLQEILEIADRIYVFHEGRTVAALRNQGLTAERILQICFSQEKGSEVNHG